MASPNLTALATTTLRNRNKELADNVSNGNALWNRLSQKGKIKLIDGGRTIVEELAYAENSTFQYYNGYEVLNIAPSDVISAAEFNWKQASTSVTISGLEGVVQNSGKEKVISLVDARITNAIDTMANNLSTGIYSDGSGSNGKQIGGLQLLVADSPSTGIVGGINRANYSFWQNKVTSFAALSLTPGSTTIQAAMNNMWLQTVRGNDKTDLIVADTPRAPIAAMLKSVAVSNTATLPDLTGLPSRYSTYGADTLLAPLPNAIPITKPAIFTVLVDDSHAIVADNAETTLSAVSNVVPIPIATPVFLVASAVHSSPPPSLLDCDADTSIVRGLFCTSPATTRYCVPLNVHPVALAHVGAAPGAASYVPGFARLT